MLTHRNPADKPAIADPIKVIVYFRYSFSVKDAAIPAT